MVKRRRLTWEGDNLSNSSSVRRKFRLFVDGDKLYDTCSNQDSPADKKLWFGYVAGISDALGQETHVCMPLSLSIAARISNDSHSDNQLPNSGADRKRGCAPAYRGRGTNFPQASAEIPASLGNWGMGRPPSLARRSPHLVPTRNWGVVVDAARA